MGVPSIGILLHEIIKLMYHARCKDPVFIRIGTCGGVGIEGGTVVVSDDAVDGLLRNTYEMVRVQFREQNVTKCFVNHEMVSTFYMLNTASLRKCSNENQIRMEVNAFVNCNVDHKHFSKENMNNFLSQTP